MEDAGYRGERVWIQTHAWPPKRRQKPVAALFVRLLDLVCTVTAWRYRRPKIMAVGTVS